MQKATDAVAFLHSWFLLLELIYIQCSQSGGVIWQFFEVIPLMDIVDEFRLTR